MDGDKAGESGRFGESGTCGGDARAVGGAVPDTCGMRPDAPSARDACPDAPSMHDACRDAPPARDAHPDARGAHSNGRLLSDDSLMREMAHLNAVIGRNARNEGGVWGLPGALAVLAGHEVAMEEGFAPRLMSQVEVAQAMGIRPQSVGALISHLEEAGFVCRVPHEGDRRAHLVALTDKGRENAQAVRERQRVFAEKALACLTVEEKTQLTNLVLKLNAALS